MIEKELERERVRVWKRERVEEGEREDERESGKISLSFPLCFSVSNLFIS